MKTTLSILFLVLLASFAEAQTTTNIAFRISVETVTAGTTNTVNTTLRLDYGTAAEAFSIDGFALGHAQNIAANGTNAPTFGVYMRQELKDQLVRPASRVAQDRVKQASAVDKIPTIIANQWDNLTQAQKNQLAAIAAAFPNP